VLPAIAKQAVGKSRYHFLDERAAYLLGTKSSCPDSRLSIVRGYTHPSPGPGLDDFLRMG